MTGWSGTATRPTPVLCNWPSWRRLFSGLKDVRREFYKYPVEVEDLLSRAFPEPGGAEAFRRTIDADVGVNRLGIDALREGGLRFAFPVVIFSGVRG